MEQPSAQRPFGPDSAAWLAVYLAKFDVPKLDAASQLARSMTSEALGSPTKLHDFLDAVWDAVSRELDCTSLGQEQQEELYRLERQLAASVVALRPIVKHEN